MSASEEGTDEEFVPEDESEQGPALVKRLREKLKKAVEEKQEYLDGWQRSRADFANFKREEAARESEKELRARIQVFHELLPALDALELALKHDQSPTLRMLEKQFTSALKKIGIERFGKEGDAFDPHMHEPLAQQHEGEKVVSLERSGYKINETTIRPAHVII